MIKIFAIFFLLLPSLAFAARSYTPVDQLGHGGMPQSSQTGLSRGNSGSSASRNAAAPAARKSEAQEAQTTAVSSTSSGGFIQLFGTVEFRRPLESLPGWLDVLKRNAANPIFIAGKHFNKTTTWEKLQAQVKGKSPLEQLRVINSFWNSWPYKEDRSNWGKPDYWEIPAQFIQKSGDCEDYAIVKYFTLKELGFDPKKMRLVVLRDTIRNLAHAVLVVYLDNDAYVLDNLSNVVLSHKRLGNYSPQYSVNEYGRWAHIKGKPAKRN